MTESIIKNIEIMAESIINRVESIFKILKVL